MYQIVFIKNSIKYRTKVQATSEYYARIKLLDKWGRECQIISCKEINPFTESKDIIEFLKGFRK